MKEDYLASLNRALSFYNIENKDEILSKYEKRYDFGIESELSEAEIEEMLGNPTEIAKKLAGGSANSEKEEFLDNKDGFNLIIKTVADSIIINESNDDLIHTYLEDTNKNCYNLKNNKTGVLMSYKKSDFFSLNRNKGVLIISIPKNTKFDLIDISTTKGSISVDTDLHANNIKFNSISGNVKINNSYCNRFYLHAVSAKYEINDITSDRVSVVTVSGNININKITGSDILVDTVTANVSILKTNAKIRSSSVTGHISINDNDIKNIKDKIKGVFVYEG